MVIDSLQALWHLLVGINWAGGGYYLCCKVDTNPGQKLAYTFQLVGAKYPLRLHIKSTKSFVEIWWRPNNH